MTLSHPFEPIPLAAALLVVGLAVLAAPARGDAGAPVLRAKAFDLAQVRLLDGPFKAAQGRDETYLLSLDPDRLLGGFRSEAGLVPKGDKYGGWEQQGVAGHTLGHYLSAVSLMYAATGDPRFKDRADYVVGQLAECQAANANANGYVGAIPDGRRIFDEVKKGKVEGEGFSLNGAWVPWYTMHKLFAGLIDADQHAGSERAKQVVVKLADWADATTANLSEQQVQQMLRAEQGGMSESLADVYAITGDAKYLGLAKRFTHHAVIDPLAAGRDELDGLHANTQVPKLIAAARIYELTGDAYYRDAAREFWTSVVGDRTYAQGGNSDHEHFFPADKTRQSLSTATAETCNVYNMLKLTKELFQLSPSRDEADFYERALFNQILGGVDPKRGMFTYFQSLRPGGFKVYSDPTHAFWCCVGTGMENPARYAEAIYFRSDDALWVNLFVPSTLDWREKGVALRQETQYPDEPTTTLTVGVEKPTRFALKLRVPAWVHGEPALTINGRPSTPKIEDGYATIEREWRDGDAVTWAVPMAVRAEPLEDAPDLLAFLYGPVTLAGQLGTEGLDQVEWYLDGHDQNKYATYPAPAVPMLVGAPAELAARVEKVADAPDPLTFSMPTAGGGAVTLRPFAQTHFVRYTVYWQTFPDQAGYDAEKGRLAQIAQAARRLDARTVDLVRIGEQQPEVDHRLQSLRSESGGGGDGRWRDARDGGFFQYEVKIDPDTKNELRVSYFGSDGGNRTFDILVDDTLLATKSLTAERPGEMIEEVYELPLPLTSGRDRDRVTVRFQAKPGSTAGGVFGVRIVRAE